MRPRHVLLATLACALPAAVSSAQSFNLDVAPVTAPTLPPSSYGAAADQPGAWTRVGSSQAATTFTFVLSDLAGAPTPARLDTFGGGPLYGGNGTTDFESLMADYTDVGSFSEGYPNGVASWTFRNLQPGLYRVYTYCGGGVSWPSQTWVQISAFSGSWGGVQIVSGAWPTSGATHALGVSYALHTVAVGGTFTVSTEDPGFDAIQRPRATGFQLEHLGAFQGVRFCAGDSAGAACPCNNTSAPGGGAGCANSTGSGGFLQAAGAASIANDALTLVATDLPESTTALFFQGTTRENGGAGSAFGDGLRCAGGTVARLGTKTVGAGQCRYPDPGDVPIAARGSVGTPSTRTYQVWYRNAASFCTAATFNLTNGVEISWGA